MNNKAWVISVNMGYGHQRTAYNLKDLAEEGIINANDYSGISKKDRIFWEGARRFYEAISRFKRAPLIGGFAFSVFDYFQRIAAFYPKQDLSKPNFTSRQIYSYIKKGWGRDLIEKLKTKNEELKRNLPLIATFFTPAFMAEYFRYPGKIFCVVCDADIARTWAPLNSKESKIKYLAPNERVAERLTLYGVREENIFLTGYPLPLKNVGDENLDILKRDLKSRLLNLDPEKRYFEKYKKLIEENFGKPLKRPDHSLTIMFSIGGAGAQKDIGIKILKSLRNDIKRGEIKIIISLGIKEIMKEYYLKNIRRLGIKLGENGSQPIEFILGKNIGDYFEKFNFALRKTDILWTKPSELSFYSALGIPIIISPAIGSQEEFNMRWIIKSGFGLLQENPNYTDQWLFDWLKQGYLAEAALEGFIEGKKLGTLKIKKIIEK
jgi:hypothetical protein